MSDFLNTFQGEIKLPQTETKNNFRDIGVEERIIRKMILMK
jgi:hypothetical protein